MEKCSQPAEAEQLSRDEVTSHVVGSYSLCAAVLALAVALVALLPHYAYLSALPFLLLCLKGFHASLLRGLFIAAIWGGWSMLLFSPLLMIGPQYIYLGLYAPLVFVMLKDSRTQPGPLGQAAQMLLWEIPLLAWIHASSALGWRALEPFYSEITECISVGSLPLACDVPFLHQQRVRGVINMCWESGGPERQYRRLGIAQLHLPTADLTEPAEAHVHLALQFLQQVRHEHPDGRVFIHCKGGRGRAVITALCLIAATHRCSAQQAFSLIKSKRAVAARAVLASKVVKDFCRTTMEKGVVGAARSESPSS